jgi:hypothetical protein
MLELLLNLLQTWFWQVNNPFLTFGQQMTLDKWANGKILENWIRQLTGVKVWGAFQGCEEAPPASVWNDNKSFLMEEKIDKDTLSRRQLYLNVASSNTCSNDTLSNCKHQNWLI